MMLEKGMPHLDRAASLRRSAARIEAGWKKCANCVGAGCELCEDEDGPVFTVKNPPTFSQIEPGMRFQGDNFEGVFTTREKETPHLWRGKWTKTGGTGFHRDFFHERPFLGYAEPKREDNVLPQCGTTYKRENSTYYCMERSGHNGAHTFHEPGGGSFAMPDEQRLDPTPFKPKVGDKVMVRRVPDGSWRPDTIRMLDKVGDSELKKFGDVGVRTVGSGYFTERDPSDHMLFRKPTVSELLEHWPEDRPAPGESACKSCWKATCVCVAEAPGMCTKCGNNPVRHGSSVIRKWCSPCHDQIVAKFQGIDDEKRQRKQRENKRAWSRKILDDHQHGRMLTGRQSIVGGRWG